MHAKTLALTLCALFVAAGLAAPAASADHIRCAHDTPTYTTCMWAHQMQHGTEDRIVCLLTTGIVYWLDECFKEF